MPAQRAGTGHRSATDLMALARTGALECHRSGGTGQNGALQCQTMSGLRAHQKLAEASFCSKVSLHWLLSPLGTLLETKLICHKLALTFLV